MCSTPTARNSWHKAARGFTFVELAVLIASVALLIVGVLVVVDPVRRIQDSRDARRYSDVNAILNALLDKQVSERAIYHGEAGAPILVHPVNAQVIVRDPSGVDCQAPSMSPVCPTQKLDRSGTRTCIADLGSAGTSLVPSSISAIPIDPRGVGAVPTTGGLPLGDNNTGYYIHRMGGNRIEVGSCHPEQATDISVMR